MNSLPAIFIPQRGRQHTPRRCTIFVALILTVISMLAARNAPAQARESAEAGGVMLWVGTGASGYYLQYGARQNLGVTAFIDSDSIRRFGVEAEGRWLEWHQTADVHVETYLVGPRYHFNVGRFQPYAKGLVGLGRFNFSYNYAYGRYAVIAPGAGVDYRLSRRWSVRVIDVEYQYWPQFTYGTMTSVGATTGIRYRIF